MKPFLLKTIYLSLTFFCILIAIGIIWDPYQTLHPKNRWDAKGFSPNREWVCLNIYQRRVQTNQTPTYFIIGSSRSHAFKTSDWSSYAGLSPDSVFHFDAFGMGILRASNLIQFLSRQKPAAKEILWILDHTIFNETEESDRFIYSEPPAISGKSPIYFHTKAIYESLHPAFIFHSCLSSLLPNFEMENQDEFTQKETVDLFTGDIYYQKNDNLIKIDSVGFYNNNKNIKKFSKYMTDYETISPSVIDNNQVITLKKIRNLLDKDGTKVKIVVSPLFSKIKMNNSDLNQLKNIFGKENVFDYSGLNEYTKEYRNYYDPSHFRRHIAQGILRDIYSH